MILAHVKGLNSEGQCANILKTCFAGVIVFHDYGKVNENFQVLRMQNRKTFVENKNTILKPTHGHSKLGVFLFVCYYIDHIFKQNIEDEQKYLLTVYCYLLAYSIAQHHSPSLNFVTDRQGFFTLLNGWFTELKIYTTLFDFDVNEELLTEALNQIENCWHEDVLQGSALENDGYKPFPFFALIKLNFSLLTAADYLATHEYSSSSENGCEGATMDLGVFESRERIEEMAKYFQAYEHNRAAFNKTKDYQFEHPTFRSKDDLNKLREEMAVEVIQTVRKNTTERLFYLEAPTGGGKTNLSAIVATELLLANPELNKVYYVFPFTTLITQTFGALKKSLGLHDDEIAEMHSKAGMISKEQNDEALQDGLFADNKKDYIDNLFALYPLTLLSHVRFFDVLKTNSKEANYLLHRLANSVVIVDELQSYNPKVWDKMLFFMSEYSRHFNIRFVLMSATLPKISGLKTGLANIPDFVELLPNARKYITNPNFAERVKFNFELFNKGKIEVDELADVVLRKSKEYASAHGHVKTIVEFIYKKSAADFLRQVGENSFFPQIFLLSGHHSGTSPQANNQLHQGQ